MIESIVDEYITDKRNGEVRRNDKFRVSDAGRCRLMRFWKRQGKVISNDFDNRVQRIFEVGHIVHEWLQDILAQKGVLIEKEKEVEDLHRLGHIDAIVQNGAGLVLYDFKTVNSRKFTYIKGNSDLHYKHQVASYVSMLPFGISSARIVYISKNDLRMLEVDVMAGNMEAAVNEDWNVLINAWEKQEEPDANPMGWECKYCTYRSSCNCRSNGKK